MAGLRAAIAQLTRLACDWSADEVSRLSGVSLIAAERYCNQLVNTQVLLPTGEQRFTCGPKAEEWRSKRTRTHVGGGAKQYQQAKALRDELATRDWHVRRGLTPPPVPTPIEQRLREVERIRELRERRRATVTVRECALFFGVCSRTIRNRIKQGKIPVAAFPGRPRIPKTFLVKAVANG